MKKSGLKFNVILSLISQFVCYISPLIVAPYISRVLGPDGIGVYSFSYSFVFYFSSLIVLGFSNLGITMISKERDDKEKYSIIFWTTLLLRFFLGIVLIGIYLGLSFCGVLGGQDNIYIMLALTLVLIGNIVDIKFLFQGLENFKIITYIQVLTYVLYIGSIFLLVKNRNDVLLYTILKSSTDLLVNIVLFVFAVKYIKRPCIDFKIMPNLLKNSLLLFVPSILINLGIQLEQTFLGVFSNNTEVGYFQQAIKFPLLIGNLTYAICPVMMARVSYLIKEGKNDEIKDKISKILLLAALLSLPCCLGLYSIGEIFVPLYFGQEFLPVVNIFYITLPISIFSPINAILINAYLYPLKKTNYVVIAAGCELIVNIILSIILLYGFNLGAIGGATACFICEVILFLLLLIFCRNSFHHKFVIRDFLKIIISALLIACAVIPFNRFVQLNIWLQLFIDVIIGAFIYGIVLIVTKEYVVLNILNYCISKFIRKEIN